jgi:hypothetical protein
MPRKTELIGRCGLYCYECPSYTQKVASLAGDLRKQLKRVEFDKYADMMAKMPGFEAFKNYKQCIELLHVMQKIRCKGCKAGGWDRSCKIRRCAIKKKYKGCWQCDIFETCQTLKLLEDGDKNIHLKNLRKIKKVGKSAFVKTKSK